MQTSRETKKPTQLPKEGTSEEHLNALQPHEFAHSTPYYYQRYKWPSMDSIPNEGPIRFLEKHLTKYDNNINLESIPILYPNIDKWIANEKLDNELSNEFGTNKNITDSQKTCILKLKHGQYMGNAMKQLFFGRASFPSITCPICNSLDPDTWLHILLKCKQHHIHALRIKRHNKAVWELRKLIVASKKSRCYILMNVGTYNNNAPKNIVLPWLLPCMCGQQRCHCNVIFKLDLLCVKGLPYQSPPLTKPNENLTIQFIRFTYCNDRIPNDTITKKTKNKNQ